MTDSGVKDANNNEIQPQYEHASESSSEASFEMPDALATGREKRSTAGNRLRDMLNAELESEAIFAEDEQDDDFGSEQDLQDDLDSELDDASSGDEQRQIEPDDAGEQSLQKQEKHSARIKKRRAIEAITKPKVGLKVNKSRSNATEQEGLKRKKKVTALINHRKRQSTRAHAVDVAGAVDRRLKQEALKKSKTTRAAKSDDRPLTQSERLEEAKITEADNVASLSTIVKYEEEKRISQKLLAARRRAIGPFIRFVSSKKSELSEPKMIDVNLEQSGSELEMIGVSLKHPMDIIQEHIEKPVVCEMQADRYTAPIKEKMILDSPSNLLNSTTTFISLENLHESSTTNLGIKELLFGTSAVDVHPYPPRPQCFLSGLASKYKDPKTGLLYGNLHAYRALRDLKTGTIPWNPQLKMYVPRSTM